MLGGLAAINHGQVVSQNLFDILSECGTSTCTPSSQITALHLDFTNPNTLKPNWDGTGTIAPNDYIRYVDNIAYLNYMSYLPCGDPANANGPFGRFLRSLADTDAASPQYQTNVDAGKSAAYFNGTTSGLYNRGASMAEGANAFAGGGFAVLGGNAGPKYMNIWIVFKSASTSASAKEVIYNKQGPCCGSTFCSGNMAYYRLQYASSDDDFEYEIHGPTNGTQTNQSNLNKSTSIELLTIAQARAQDGTADVNRGRIYRNGDVTQGVNTQTWQNESINGVSFGSNLGECLYQTIGCNTSNSSYQPSAFSDFWSGHVFEIIVNSANMCVEKRIQIDTYLKNKYGIS